MRYELMFPSRYFKGADFAAGARDMTIKAMVTEEVRSVAGDKAEPKWIVYFDEELEKSLILNKTNAKAIAAMHGTETDDWVGKRVCLFMAQTNGKGGEMVDCVRVRACTGKAAKK